MAGFRFARASWFVLVFALGCSETVETEPGGGGSGGTPNTNAGGGGAGPANGGGGAGMGGMAGIGGDPTGMGGVSSTGGSGGGDACTQACTFVATCGVPGDQCMQYLDCSNPQGACAADCVNAPGVDCNALFAALQGQPGPLTDCIGACQGGMGGGGMGGSGTGGGGTGGGGMGDAQACQQCAQNQCGAELQQCFQAGAQACQSWVQCAQACQDQACIETCSTMYPAGEPVGDCLCGSCVNDGCGYTCD
ncbi:MAG: hypothetical protein HOW73_27235 [Polyangiaceae bacterium]|nr:hypothetical protein [Polyangiaceae bacterium]